VQSRSHAAAIGFGRRAHHGPGSRPSPPLPVMRPVDDRPLSELRGLHVPRPPLGHVPPRSRALPRTGSCHSPRRAQQRRFQEWGRQRPRGMAADKPRPLLALLERPRRHQDRHRRFGVGATVPGGVQAHEHGEDVCRCARGGHGERPYIRHLRNRGTRLARDADGRGGRPGGHGFPGRRVMWVGCRGELSLRGPQVDPHL
jgi:hypothetical protein